MTPAPRPTPPRVPAALMMIGSEMAGFTVVGVLLDLYVFKSLPWFTIGLTVLGFAVVFFHLVRFAGTLKQPSGLKPSGVEPPGVKPGDA